MLDLKDKNFIKCLVVSSYALTLKYEVKQRQITRTALSAASGDKQTAVSRLLATV